MHTEQNKLTKKDKEAVGLLSIGTFLEYFDLMLYVHMSVLMNELFFPKTDDPTMISFYAAISFCSSYIFRPIGSLIIGFIGDIFGRKVVLMITSFSMAAACITISMTKTYAEIGIIATITVTICRFIQGFSSLGELSAASLYVTESYKSPNRYSICASLSLLSRMGGTFALVIALCAFQSAFEWRLPFILGAAVALIGMGARYKLRESGDFIKSRFMQNKSSLYTQNIYKKLTNYFFITFISTIWLYYGVIHSSVILKTTFNFTAEEIINHNMKVMIVSAVIYTIMPFLLQYIHPIKIVISQAVFTILSLPIIVYNLANIDSVSNLFIIQVIILTFTPGARVFMDSVCSRYFYIRRRFTVITLVPAISHSIGYIGTSFGLHYLTMKYGAYALLIYSMPCLILFLIACNYFKKLEIQKGRYHHYPYKDDEVEEDLYNYNYELKKEYEPFKKECKYSSKLLEKIESINKTAKVPVNIKLVKKAIAFAKKWHDGQMRKTGEPYYTHPLAVAMMTAQYKYKTYMIVSAILHDVVEDSDCTVELIAKEFNPRIAEIVKLLTREEENRKLTIADSMKKIFDAKDYDALLIKGLDRLHNLQTIRGMKPEKRRKIAEETIYEIANIVAYAVDDLNINNKNKLEKKLYKLSNKALKSAMNNS